MLKSPPSPALQQILNMGVPDPVVRLILSSGITLYGMRHVQLCSTEHLKVTRLLGVFKWIHSHQTIQFFQFSTFKFLLEILAFTKGAQVLIVPMNHTTQK